MDIEYPEIIINSRIAEMIDRCLSLTPEETLLILYTEFQNSNLENKHDLWQDIFKLRQRETIAARTKCLNLLKNKAQSNATSSFPNQNTNDSVPSVNTRTATQLDDNVIGEGRFNTTINRLEEVVENDLYSKEVIETHIGSQILEESRRTINIDNIDNKADIASETTKPKTAAYAPKRRYNPNESRTCPICNKTYSNIREKRRHMMRHKNEKNFKCMICEAAFFSRVELKRHLVKHSGLRSFACEYCDKTYVHFASKTKHCKIKHNC